MKSDLVYGVATEDMDALTFGTPRLLRHLTSPASRKEPIIEIDLATVLAGLEMNMDQFVDLCILCGCDYSGSIRGIGPQTALKLIQTHKSIAEALKHLDKDKYKSVEQISDCWIGTVCLCGPRADLRIAAAVGCVCRVGDDFLPAESAALFKNPEVTPASEIKLEWKDPDEAGIIKFLVDEKGFNLERVQNALKRLVGARGKASQQRIEGFFKMAAPKETFEKPNAKRKGTATSTKKQVRHICGHAHAGRPRSLGLHGDWRWLILASVCVLLARVLRLVCKRSRRLPQHRRQRKRNKTPFFVQHLIASASAGCPSHRGIVLLISAARPPSLSDCLSRSILLKISPSLLVPSHRINIAHSNFAN